MYKVLNIDKKDYKIEYSIEASLYGECTEQVINLMDSLSGNENVDNVIKGISNVPHTVLVMFYAGLMEHHGEDGDGTVTNLKDAKDLLKMLLTENKGSDLGDFYGILNVLIEQMGEDGFFGLIGLDKIVGETETPKKVAPQDHKKKSTATTKKVTSLN